MLKHPKKIPNRQQSDSIPDMSICQIINDKYRGNLAPNIFYRCIQTLILFVILQYQDGNIVINFT